jgi:hypothetical protein
MTIWYTKNHEIQNNTFTVNDMSGFSLLIGFLADKSITV